MSVSWSATTTSLNWTTAKSDHGLDHRFPRRTPGETRKQLAQRMAKLEAYLNSDDFPSRAGGGLEVLARSLHRRCQRVVGLEGGRLRT